MAERFFHDCKMNILDIVMAVPMLLLLLRGWMKGVVRTLATLAGLLLGIWAAVHLSQWVSVLLNLKGESAVIIAFFVTFVGALVLTFLLGRGVEQLLKASKLGIVNRIAGAALGLVEALCILAVLLGNVVALDKNEKLITAEMKTKSWLYKPVNETGNRLMTSLRQYIDEHKDEWKEAMQ